MSWSMLEKPKTVLASKSLVAEFSEMEPAPYDRPLSERRMMIYQRILNSGDFRPVTWASVHCTETNCVYRVNGKHTSRMLSLMDKVPEFYVTIERWKCDTLNDVAALYNTYDSNLASRSTQDINRAFAATVPELREVPQRYINLTVSANALNKWEEIELRKVPPAEKAEELLDRVDFVKWLMRVVPSSNLNTGSLAKPLLRTPVVCAMLATYDRAAHYLCEKFWTEVRDETAADRNDPTRVLARWLIRAVLGGSNVNRNAGKCIVGHREMYAKCILGWNAWRKEANTTLQYHANSPLPSISK